MYRNQIDAHGGIHLFQGINFQTAPTGILSQLIHPPRRTQGRGGAGIGLRRGGGIKEPAGEPATL